MATNQTRVRRLDAVMRAAAKIVDRHHFLFSLLVVIVASAIFVYRNTAAFTLPNFYAEDATVLYQNIYSLNPLRVLLTPFNGYLIVGQYLLAYLAAGVNLVLGNNIVHLPQVTAAVSCLFLGLSASLPYILFKRQLGTLLSLLVVLLTAFVPLASYDYAIIGTISNLKFVFLYIAFLLVVYRVVNPDLSMRKRLLIDGLLLLCALTNATVAFLLPFTLLPYMPAWWQALKKRRFQDIFSKANISALVLSALGFLYAAAAVLRGIPTIPGYLDGPFNPRAILPIADRSTFYALTYPFTTSWNSWFIAALLVTAAVVAGILIMKRGDRAFVVAAACWSIFLGTGLFIINRPGIGDYYLNYGHKGGPDQFFFAQNMVFIFAIGWLVKDWAKRLSLRGVMYGAIAVLLYLLVAVPFGTSFGDSAVVFKDMKTIDVNVARACELYKDKRDVIIQIYPTPYWQWKVNKHLACD